MKKLLSCLVLSTMLAFTSSAFAQDGKTGKPGAQQTLPNGASSLSESFGLWTVSCAVQDGEKACAMMRQEVNSQNQPVLNMNVTSNADGSISGVMVVPFGLLVTKPVNLQVDESKTMVTSSVRTCFPAGCIVPVAFDKNAVAGLRAGKQLKLKATSSGNGEPPIDNLFVQLDGFASALDRLTALKK